MTPRRLRPAVVLTAAALLALPAVASAGGPVAPTVLSVEANDTPVDAWAGWIVWSRRGADGAFSMVVRDPAGHGTLMPVPTQMAPFDASIGPNAAGDGPLIAYSRCTKPTGAFPTGCDVHTVDPRTGAGGTLPAASDPRLDERLPAVHGGRIAFSRTLRPGDARRAEVVVADTTAARAPARGLRGPTTERRAGRTVRLRVALPQGLDFDGRTVAVTWRTVGARDRSRLLVAPAGGRTTREVAAVASARGTLAQLGRPALRRSDVVVPRTRTGARSRSDLLRTTLSGRRTWVLDSGFTPAQTERLGSAFTAAAWSGADDLVVLRRLANDGRWSCKHPAVQTGGCELLALRSDRQPWRRVRR
ncbi:hypothetical protein [Patulibacter sp. SYSU D01012]|uniref:hypothetical protein n=1 Tax=Patulibacter sp. SYSU D01012 TaxID=2817381 RepID=UPI001B31329A|nr:hypothetical protein [Patulibacter sp. SYSU D01012]